MLTRAQRELEELGIAEPLMNENFDFIPSWEKQNFRTDTTLHKHKKSELNADTWKKLAREVEERYREYEIRFTDGSKRNGATACAVTSKTDSIYQARLADHASVYTAEQTAICIAARLKSTKKKVAIMTDSLASIMALDGRRGNGRESKLFRNMINKADNEVVIVWMPSHQGIQGNETADEAAKMALGLAPQQIYTVADNIRLLKSRQREEEQRTWLAMRHNFLREIKENTERSQLPTNLSRTDEKKITRIRMGITPHTHEHVFHGLTNKHCDDCEEIADEVKIIDIHHIMDECIKFREKRSRFNINSNDLKYSNRYDDIINFFKSIELYDKI
jgi:ribonuclease HI